MKTVKFVSMTIAFTFFMKSQTIYYINTSGNDVHAGNEVYPIL